MKRRMSLPLAIVLCIAATGLARAEDNVPPPGFTALFNGKDLTGWQGLVEIWERDVLTKEQLAAKQKEANAKYLPHWSVQDGVIVYDGKGQSLQTVKDYRNFELWCDWKIHAGGDSGIYLRGQPQVQIWDPDKSAGNAVGSGGLFNNAKNPSKPSKRADKPVGEWNRFRIVMIGEKVWIWLNGELVVENVTLENYWAKNKKNVYSNPDMPVPAAGPIELQHHGDALFFKNIFIKELPDDAKPPVASAASGSSGETIKLFNGRDLAGWKRFLDPRAADADPDKTWSAKDGVIVCTGKPAGYLLTEKEYENYVLTVEWRWGPSVKEPKGPNSGVFVHVVGEDKIWPKGVEAQLASTRAGDFWLVGDFKLKVDPARQDPKVNRHYFRVKVNEKDEIEKPLGEWNKYEITCKGDTVKLVVNGHEVNVGTDAEVTRGKILLQSEGTEVHFRNVELRPIK